MGFIDYHGTKEDRFTEVLEYAHALQEEDWKRKDAQKTAQWLEELIGNSDYVRLTSEDLLRHVIASYQSTKKAWLKMCSAMAMEHDLDPDQLWKDFSVDLASRHLGTFHLDADRRNKYLQTFHTKVFKLDDSFSAEEHNRNIAEIAGYRRYFAECFDPTWKGQHLFKWLGSKAKGVADRQKLIDVFLVEDLQVSLFLGLYLHQAILPRDEGWMRGIETERAALSDIRDKIRRGTLFEPDCRLLINPLTKGKADYSSPDVAGATGNQLLSEELSESLQIPNSGLDQARFKSLIRNGEIPDYVAAAKLLLECSLPEEIAQIYRQLIERMPILQDAVARYQDVYQADMDQFKEYFAPEALKITAVYLDYQAVKPAEKILKETRDGVFLATRKLLQVVNEKIDEIYRFVMIDANAESKALESLMSQDGYVDPEYRIHSGG